MQADTSVAIRPRQCSNENRFKSLDTEEIDDIGGKTCKKTTHKQTEWGI